MLAGLAALVVCGLIPLLPPFQNLTWTGVFALAVVYAFGVLSVVVLSGYVGQVSLCQATFVGLAAFSTAALVNGLGFNYFVSAGVGVLGAFVLGVIVGIPALRLRGILLAIVTAGVALCFDYYFFQDPQFTWFNGGVGGWQVAGTSVLGVAFDPLKPDHLLHTYWLALAVFALVSVLVVNLHDSGSGRRLRAIRDSEIAAATMGVDLTLYKLLAFGLSAAIAGIGGAFFPLVEGTVTNFPFSFFISLQLAAVAVLVGIRFVPAAVVGGVFIAIIPQALLALQDLFHVEINGNLFQLVLGLLLIGQVIAVPDGVWGQWAHAAEQAIRRRPPPPRPAAESS
jgi:branched-chain amino acid transport system permease protein